MRGKLFLIGCLLLTVILAACHYRIAETVVPAEGREGADSLVTDSCLYSLNANFQVTADTLWLHQLPLTDSIPVCRDDELVVAEISVHSEDTIGQRWVKVARDQSTIGWVREKDLLKEIVPVDPISQCIHWFSSSHALPFFIVLGVFFLAYAYRAVHRKQIRLIWLNDIDSVFPITLSWLMAAAATLYNSLQHFVPETWERYYYNPTLNPFELPFILSLFIISVALILLVSVALLDDLFHQTSLEVAFFYLVGLAACCIFLYIFFTMVWIWLAYLCFVAYTAWCVSRLRKSGAYPYACGACGAKMRTKGVCPHCGAINE